MTAASSTQQFAQVTNNTLGATVANTTGTDACLSAVLSKHFSFTDAAELEPVSEL